MFHRLVIYCLAVATMLAGGLARAQDAPAVKPKYDKYGSPLDTIRNTRLWTDVPPAEDFVKATHPEAKTLDYAPLTGTDPVRPKARDAANVQALRAEMDRDLAINTRKGHGAWPAASASAKPRTNAAKAVVAD